MLDRHTLLQVPASLALVLCAAACTTSSDGGRASAAKPQQSELPWTKEFEAQSVLTANEVLIVGPPGLIAHVAFKQFPEQQIHAQTIADGFVQELTIPDDAPNPIWVQIDNLAINAYRHARVLESVREGPVVIRASGQVHWKNLATGAEQESEQLELRGARPQ